MKKEVKNEILSMLDQNDITKKDIFDNIQDDFKINDSDLRVIFREIRSDFLKKLTVLQSGVVRV